MRSFPAVFLLFSLVNLFNFLDRGIIPGSTNEFNSFILKTTQNSQPDILLGLLQSSFVFGFLIGAVIFGHLIHYISSRFTLTRIGSVIWLFAVFASGLAYYSNSYLLLLFCRMISGFGEASLQCSIPPWIQEKAIIHTKGFWLSVFYTAIPVGTAFGYAFSAAVTSTMQNWSFAFLFEGMIASPIILVMFFVNEDGEIFSPFSLSVSTPSSKRGVEGDGGLKEREKEEQEEEEDDGLELLANDEEKVKKREKIQVASDEKQQQQNPTQEADDKQEEAEEKEKEKKPTIWEEFWIVCQRPVFLALIFGQAAQNASLMGLSTFGSAFLLGLGFFDVETAASSAFGILVSLAGIIATPLGGFLLDKLISRRIIIPTPSGKHETHPQVDLEEEEIEEIIHSPAAAATAPGNFRNKKIMLQTISQLSYWLNYFGSLFFCLTFYLTNEIAFLAFIGIGCACIFATSTAINMGTMLSVPTENQSFAIALTSLVGHIFGDVPSPVIAGWLKDSLAPDCIPPPSSSSSSTFSTNSSDIYQNYAATAACRGDNDGLRMTIFLVSVWLYWTVVLFGMAWYLTLS